MTVENRLHLKSMCRAWLTPRCVGWIIGGTVSGMRVAEDCQPAVSVVLPVYDGASFLAETLRALVAHLASRDWRAEVIVVDDGSGDETAAIATAVAETSPLPVRVLRAERNEGKGAAVARGARAAAGAQIIFLDADLAYPPSEIDAVRAALCAGADVAIASRVHPDSRYVIRPSFFRYLYTRHLAGRLFNALVRALLLPGLRDTQAGLKGFSAAAAAQLFAVPLPRGFSFDLGLLARARALGLRIAEVGVVYRYDSEPTTVRFLLDTAVVLRDLLLLRFGFRVSLGQPARRRTGLWRRLQPPWVGAVLLAFAGGGAGALAIARLAVPSGRVAVEAWLVLVVACALLTARADPRPRRSRRHWGWAEALALAAVLALGAGLRGYALADFPPMMHQDTAECGLRGLEILHGRVADVFDFSTWYNTPYLSFVPYAASYALMGPTILGLRLPSVIFGTLALLALYLFARRWFGALAALIATALVAVSHVGIHFSRIGLWNIQTLLYEVAAFALVARGVQTGRRLPMFTAGVIAGLALYSYTAGRLIPIVVVVFLATLLRPRRVGRVLRLTAYFVFGVTVAATPLALNYVKDPSILEADRTASVWVLADENREHLEATMGTAAPLAVLWQQVVRTVEGFGVLGDTSSQYGTEQPLVTPWMACLALVGLVLAARRWRVARYRFLLVWAVCGLLLGSILVLDPPSHTRLLVLVPLPYLLAALALATAVDAVRRRAPSLQLSVAVAAAVAVIALAAAANLSGYRRFNEVMREMPREWDVLRVMERLGDGYDYYLFTGPFLLADSPIFHLFAARTRAVTAFTAADLPDRLSGDSAFILLGDRRGLGATISERFPGSQREEIEQEGRLQMVVYKCAAADGCAAAFN